MCVNPTKKTRAIVYPHPQEGQSRLQLTTPWNFDFWLKWGHRGEVQSMVRWDVWLGLRVELAETWLRWPPEICHHHQPGSNTRGRNSMVATWLAPLREKARESPIRELAPVMFWDSGGLPFTVNLQSNPQWQPTEVETALLIISFSHYGSQHHSIGVSHERSKCKRMCDTVPPRSNYVLSLHQKFSIKHWCFTKEAEHKGATVLTLKTNQSERELSLVCQNMQGLLAAPCHALDGKRPCLLECVSTLLHFTKVKMTDPCFSLYYLILLHRSRNVHIHSLTVSH